MKTLTTRLQYFFSLHSSPPFILWPSCPNVFFHCQSWFFDLFFICFKLNLQLLERDIPSLNMHIFAFVSCSSLYSWRDNIIKEMNHKKMQNDFHEKCSVILVICMRIQLWCQEMATCFQFREAPISGTPSCSIVFLHRNFNQRSIIFYHDDHCALMKHFTLISARVPSAFISLSFHLNFICQRIITARYT